jgi:hypothetical protein
MVARKTRVPAQKNFLQGEAMSAFTDHLMLSRMQFAFTAMYHILWPVLTIGLSLYLHVHGGELVDADARRRRVQGRPICPDEQLGFDLQSRCLLGLLAHVDRLS